MPTFSMQSYLVEVPPLDDMMNPIHKIIKLNSLMDFLSI